MYTVSNNLSVCLSVTKYDLNYLRTGEIVQLDGVSEVPNTHPDSPHSHGVMKFATQISPLLNLCIHLSIKAYSARNSHSLCDVIYE